METRRKFDQQFKEGAVRIVRETGKPIAQVARDLGIHQGTLGRWVNGDRRAREGGDGRLDEGERADRAVITRTLATAGAPGQWRLGGTRKGIGERGGSPIQRKLLTQ